MKHICDMVSICRDSGTSEAPPFDSDKYCRHMVPHNESSACYMVGGCMWTDMMRRGKGDCMYNRCSPIEEDV